LKYVMNVLMCLKYKILLTQFYPHPFPYKYCPFPYIFHAPFLERERE
jgi:hypothetical protein